MRTIRTVLYNTLVDVIGSSVLVIFMIVSLMPSNALAFESSLATSVTPMLFVPKNDTIYAYQAHTAVVYPSPITVLGKRGYTAPTITRVLEVPTSGAPLVMEGEASFYSRAGCLGCNPLRIMANGQSLDDGALTMAIGADKKHLVGHNARVTNLVTDQSVVVRITDTGGFYKEKYGNRVADLTIASKQAIGMNGGVGQVRVEVY